MSVSLFFRAFLLLALPLMAAPPAQRTAAPSGTAGSPTGASLAGLSPTQQTTPSPGTAGSPTGASLVGLSPAQQTAPSPGTAGSLTGASLAGVTPARQTAAPGLASQLRTAPFGETWDDGQAEVATYEAVRLLRGRERPHTAHLITVAETFNRHYYVKADWPHGDKPLLPVIRQTLAATIPAADSPRHLMTSVFAGRGSPARLIKMSQSWQEWDGVSFKEFQLWGDRPMQHYHSFHDGDGSGSRPLDVRGEPYFEEHLFLLLRGLNFREGLTARFRLYSSQATAKAPEPRAVGARLAVAGGEDAWEVTINAEDGRTLQFDFAREEPHHLIRFSHSDGREMTLRSLRREAYWEQAD